MIPPGTFHHLDKAGPEWLCQSQLSKIRHFREGTMSRRYLLTAFAAALACSAAAGASAQHGDTVAGKKIELIIRDDAAVPDNTKRIAQELIVNDKVNFLGGFGVTPAALSVAPLSAES